MAKQIPHNIRISAPVTPFSQSGDLMGDAFEEIVRWHLDHGSRGLLIAADNGEHWSLTTAEIAQLTRIAMKLAGDRVPVYVGAWAISERETIERANAAAEAGAYGLCVKPQSYVHAYSPPTERDVVGRFEAVGRAVPLPMMVYNSHNRTNVNITHELLHKIIDAVEVDCLKDTNGDANFILERVMQFNEKVAVLVTEKHFFEGMMLGGAGIVGTLTDLFGSSADDIFNYETMTVAQRREWQTKLDELGGAINYFGSVPSPYKSAWNMMGLPAGYLRDPIRPISPEQESALRALLEKWKIIDRKN